MTAACAAGALAPAKSAFMEAAVPATSVTVKLGAAMLEEYHGSNPASRTTILRGGEFAQKATSNDSGKKRS